MAEVEDRVQQQQEQETTPTEPAMSPLRTLEKAVAQALPTVQTAQPLHRSTVWLQRSAQDEETMLKEKQEHEDAVRRWEQEMQRVQQNQPTALPPGPRPTAVATETNIRYAPDVRAVLQAKGPAG